MAAIAGLGLVESVQVLIAASVISSFVPIKINSFAQYFWPLIQQTIQPERESFLYHVFIAANVALTGAGVWFWRRRLQEPALARRLLEFGLWETGWIVLQLYAVFAMTAHPNWGWPKVFFYVVFAASWAFKIFWPEADRLIKAALARQPFVWPMWLRWVWDGLLLGLLGLVFYMPHPSNAVAVAFTTNQMAGLKQMPFFSGAAAAHYEDIFRLFALAAVIYSWSVYVFLRVWLRSTLLAGAGLWLAVKLQFFHGGLAPLPWAYPAATGLLHPFDMLVLVGLWRHARSSSPVWLWLSGVCAGLSWQASAFDGLMQTGMFTAYVLLCGRNAFALVPLVLALAGAWLSSGEQLWSGALLAQGLQQAFAALDGPGGAGWTGALRSKNFFSFFMAFIVPLIYAMNLAVAFRLNMSLSSGPWKFLILLCAYGLISFTSFVINPQPNGFYAYAPVLVAVLFFWLKDAVSLWVPAPARFLVRLAVFVVCVGALLSNVVFSLYPNIFDLGRVDWAQYKAVYAQHAPGAGRP